MNFKKELEMLLNKYSKENGSDTPDFILAEYLDNCLKNFDNIVNQKNKWDSRLSNEFSKTKTSNAPTILITPKDHRYIEESDII